MEEVAKFLEYLQYKQEQQPPKETPYKPVALGGLWRDVTIGEEDIAQVRRDMWDRLGANDL